MPRYSCNRKYSATRNIQQSKMGSSRFRTLITTIQRIPLAAVVLFILCFTFVISRFSSTSYVYGVSPLNFGTPERQSAAASENRPTMDGSSEVASDEWLRNGPNAPRWTYVCDSNSCKRREADESEVINSLEVCWLTCGSHGSVWPYPKSQTKGKDTVKFLPGNVRLTKITAPSEEVQGLIQEAFLLKTTFFENYPRLISKTSSFAFMWPFSRDSNLASTIANNFLHLSIAVNSTETVFSLATDESYEMRIEEDAGVTNGIHLSVLIYGRTFFGIRHGLETLGQLIALDASRECLQILKTYYVQDRPKYPYRGILIDAARNFVPLNILRRIVDGMSFNKLNIMHLHLTDSNSFTFHSNRVPQLTQYGALSEDHIYFPQELKEFVKYARVRGVKIIPELDAPSHAGNGWQFGKKLDLGDLAFYINTYDAKWKNLCGQPPCGILNPLNMHVYDFLERLYADFFDVFDKDLFHMGGDEVNTNSWKKQPTLQTWISQHGNNAIKLWQYFQTQAFDRLRKQSEKVTAMLWTSSLTAEEAKQKYLNVSNYIIQVWEPTTSRETSKLIDRGFSVVLSYVDKFYLDWGEGTWLGREQNWPYHMWQKFYDTKIDYYLNANTVQRKSQILGAEAPLWSEKTGPWQVEVKLWPRAAAFAENLWSSPPKRDDSVYSRLNFQNHRMQRRGIPTGQLQPESCLHFNGHCKNPVDMI